MKKAIAGAIGIVVVSSTLAWAAAHGDAVNMRKNGMAAVGAAMGTLVGMAQGKAEFDGKAALNALRSMNYVAHTFGAFFPEGSTGADTTASQAIWEDAAGFEAAVVKFQADTAAAIASPPASQADVGALLGTIGGNCKQCHETYRIKN